MKKTRGMFTQNLRYFCLVGVIALGLMTIVGTGGGGGGGGGDGDADTTDNSKFYGTFNYSGTETESCPDSGTETNPVIETFTIGSDYSRRAEENYIYIPSTESSTTYSYTDQDGDYVTSTITISGDTIRMEITAECSGEPSPCSTDDILFTFNSSHSGGTISGTGSDADGCQWTDTGSFTKVVTTCTDTDSDGYYAESGCGTEVDLNDTDPNYQSRGSRVMR